MANKKLSYHRVGDYYLPDIEAPEAPHIGKYGRMRFRYLGDHRSIIFNVMLINGTLNQHLEGTDQQANERLELLISQMTAREGVTEQLKADEPMEWTGRMNNVRAREEEIILKDLIFA